MDNDESSGGVEIELRFATIDEIAEELRKRTKSMLLVVEKPVRNSEDGGFQTFWGGGYAAGLGLAAYATHDMLATRSQSRTVED